MSTEAIKVTVKLFAAYQEAYRQETIDLEFNEPKQV
ncbi:MAG: molybdopterin synthase sulfur carrier subunit, partial [Cyanobacteria bacterium J083]